MNNFNRIILSLLISIFFTNIGFAKENPKSRPSKPNGSNNSGSGAVAGCSPANYRSDLDLNNVRAMIHTGGDMWWDLNGNPRYEIPKGSRKTSLFAGALWLGGRDVNNQLKVAAQRFRQDGVDYWTGPLDLVNAEIDANECNKWDKHFLIYRREVEEFRGWFLSSDREGEFPGYKIPNSILDWPWQGDVSKGQAAILAPFVDVDEDGEYDPINDGDYPKYDLDNSIDCRTDRSARIYGDQTLFWIFNDKGNVHTETGANPIGMEIHAQAFAFSTNDDINNMTFYNYRLYNRSTFSLVDTYFGVWVDPDLGNALDDFVGCDVMRGLGYCYNGDAVDGNGAINEYGANPPAVGVDFFEGPFQDNDSIDNAIGIGFNEALNGLGYGDGFPDNERFGMRRFLYHNNFGQGGNINTTDPENGSDYYNYLRGIWKDGTKMIYGGTGHISGNGDPTTFADFMFPDDTDQEFFWGTQGKPVPRWNEELSGNVPADRRFLHSAGPFKLEPGAINDITVGVVWARALSGGAFQSVRKLKQVDDKAQQLFANCFRVLNGPDAPDSKVVELDREIIIQLENSPLSNNYLEQYAEIDGTIPEQSSDSANPVQYDRFYRFQGYQIFQLKDATVGSDQLYEVEKARLVAQSDIKDSVVNLVNFTFNDELGASIPLNMTINAANNGVQKSYRILEDQFATGDRRLVNHKEYYFLVIAYGYNEFKKYDQLNPLALDGQLKPYISSRKSATGAIRVVTAIPRKPSPAAGGTVLNSAYGDGPFITRIEGTGNGSNFTDLVQDSENEILANGKADFITYQKGRGPLNIKIVDPLSVKAADFELKFLVSNSSRPDTARWTLKNLSNGELFNSDATIKVGSEQIFEDFGFSITIQDGINPGTASDPTNGYVGAEIVFSNPNLRWLTGVEDIDIDSPFDWIKSGTGDNDYSNDPSAVYEAMGVPFFAPYGTVSAIENGPGFPQTTNLAQLSKLASVDIVFTSDKSKWTRCPVIENQEDSVIAQGRGSRGRLRDAPSVDKEGKPDGSGTIGLGWFPGYAINLETGERMNMAFSEDSWFGGDNGRDMKWNPTSNLINSVGEFVGGGKHFIYVFANQNTTGQIGAYDDGAFGHSLLVTNSATSLRNFWRSCTWVGFPLLADGQSLLSTDVRVKLRVSKPYEKYLTSSNINDGFGLYRFSTKGMEVKTNDQVAAESALDLIKAVPNPYYAFSTYERDQLDNRIKIINLPDECVVTIYTVSGTLVRQFKKSDKTSTSIEWNLTNTANIPIAGGAYLIHVDVPNVGEKVVKWFGVMRPIDLETF